MSRSAPRRRVRRGVVVPLAICCLVVCLGFAAFAFDVGVISLSRSELQSAANAASLAASQQLNSAIQTAAFTRQDPSLSLSRSKDLAREAAVHAAALNGVCIDPETDVLFGRRRIDSTGVARTQWHVDNPNTVRVVARLDRKGKSKGKAKGHDKQAEKQAQQLTESRLLSSTSTDVVADATAEIKARDLVLAIDFSSSMNNDSSLAAISENRLDRAIVEQNLDDIWQKLVDSQVTYSDSNALKFPATGFGRVNSLAGVRLKPSSLERLYHRLELDGVPWPQEGRSEDGALRGTPSPADSKALWLKYIQWVRTDRHVKRSGYRNVYGFRTLIAFLGEYQFTNDQSEDLWRAPYYQFEAVKDGVSQLVNFLEGLEYGDHLGMVSFWSGAQVETKLEGEGLPRVNIEDRPITDNFIAFHWITRYKQAGHYGGGSGIGFGIYQSRNLLEEHSRPGTCPTILLLSDGQANRHPPDFDLETAWPGWDWNEVTDFDGDGRADYRTGDKAKQYAFYEARVAIETGVLIHTMAVGSDSDVRLLQAIALAAGGTYYEIPSGLNALEYREEMREAFAKIAANVPPTQLTMTPKNPRQGP